MTVKDSIQQKPALVELKAENIPQEMKEIPQWIGWKASVKDDGSVTKIPYGLDGKYKSSFKKHHTFQQVLASYQSERIDGIGFAMGGAAEYICIDLDADSLEDIPDSLKAIANQSYAELSPSGNGIHIWFKGEWPGDKSSRGKEVRKTKDGYKVEVYYETGYLTMTGETLNDLEIEESQDMLNYIYDMTRGEEKTTPAATIHPEKPELEDAAVLKKLLAHKSNRDLYTDGDTSKFDHDHSKADFALCMAMARLSTDEKQIERLLRSSKLYREKWDKHATYLKMSIAKAMLNVATEEAVKLAQQEKELDEFSVIPQEEKKQQGSAYFGGPKGNTFISKRLGDEIRNEFPTFFDGNYLYVYQNGVYRRDNGGIIGKLVVEKLGEMFKNERLKDTVAYLKNKRWIDPDQTNIRTDLINVKNGLLDWKTGELLPHTSDYLSTVQLPVTYEPKEKSPNIAKFISEIVPEDAIPTLYEWFGYSMIPSTRYEKALILTGSGANGKSKFLELYQKFIGYKHVSNVALQELENNRFKVAQLQGKLANVYADISSQGLEKTDAFKTVASGDRVTAEFKGSQGFEFTPFARLTFSANELPRTNDLTDGFFRKLLIIDFPNKFGQNGLKKDPHIMDKISTEKELSGLLNAALEGLRRLETNGCFTENESTIKGIEKYKRDVNPLLTFIEECCTVEKDFTVEKKKLYETYRNWAFESGLKPLGTISFYRRISKENDLEEFRPSARSSHHYRGIGLQDTDSF